MRPREAGRAGGNRHRRAPGGQVLTLLHHEILGPPDGGEGTVLLSAGLGGAGAFWQPQLAALLPRFRVILYDQRGTGRSPGPVPDPCTIADMANDVFDVLNHLEIPSCHFVGHALGGLIGMDLARLHPTAVQTLTLVNAWSRLDAQTALCFRVRLDLLNHAGPEAYVRAQPLFLYPAPWLSQNAARIARDTAHGTTHFQGAETLLRRLAALQSFDITAHLPEITCPVLVAASRDDLLVPWTSSDHLAKSLPNARLFLVPEGGHAFTVTRADAFNDTLCAFLTEPRPV